MRSSVVAEIFLLFLLISLVHGIRLKEEFKSVIGHQKIKEEERLMTKKSIGDVNGDDDDDDNKVTACRDVRYCSGKNRKLVTMTTPITDNSITKEQNENGVNSETTTSKKSGKGNGKHGEDEPQELYPDMLDIAEMDYTSARRKTPIHN